MTQLNYDYPLSLGVVGKLVSSCSSTSLLAGCMELGWGLGSLLSGVGGDVWARRWSLRPGSFLSTSLCCSADSRVADSLRRPFVILSTDAAPRHPAPGGRKKPRHRLHFRAQLDSFHSPITLEPSIFFLVVAESPSLPFK